MQRREVSRYRDAAVKGQPVVLLEEKQDELESSGQRREALAERRGGRWTSRTASSSPIDGTVLRHSRPGERPGSEGILAVGASDRWRRLQRSMRVTLADPSGQSASLISENGGFSKLKAEVVRILRRSASGSASTTPPVMRTPASLRCVLR